MVRPAAMTVREFSFNQGIMFFSFSAFMVIFVKFAASTIVPPDLSSFRPVENDSKRI